MRRRALVTAALVLALLAALATPATATTPGTLRVWGWNEDGTDGSSPAGLVVELLRMDASGALGDVVASATTSSANLYWELTPQVSSGGAVVRVRDPFGRYPTMYGDTTFHGATYGGDETAPPSKPTIDLSQAADTYVPIKLTPAGRYVPVDPVRIADTREDGAPMTAGEIWNLPMAPDIVGWSATAVVLNVTTTRTACRTTYLSAGPYFDAGTRPGTSILNARGGVDVANLVTVRLGFAHAVALYDDQCATDVVIDLEGYYTTDSDPDGPGAGFEPVTPKRVVDTREPGQGGAWGAGERRRVDLAAAATVPDDAVAVAVNLTSTRATATTSYVSAFATGDPAGTSSSVLNARRGQDVANLAIVPLADDGSIEIYNNAGTTELIADVLGWYTASGGADFYALDGRRTVAPPHLAAGQTQLVTDPGHQIELPAGAVALALNLTSTHGTAATSYLTAFPAAVSRPTSSNVNTVVGVDLANSALVALDGGFRVYNNAGEVDVYEDVYGYFADRAVS